MSFKKNLSLTKYISNSFTTQITVLTGLILLRIFEYFYFKSNLIVLSDFILFETIGFAFDVLFWSSYVVILGVIFLPLIKFPKTVNFILIFFGIFILLSNLALLFFFVERGSALDKELITNSFTNSITTVKSSNQLDIQLLFASVLIIVGFLVVRWIINKTLKISLRMKIIVFFAAMILFIINIFVSPDFYKFKYSTNKIDYLTKSIFNYLINNKELEIPKAGNFPVTEKIKKDIVDYQDSLPFSFVDTAYPFLRKRENQNTLGQFFNLKEEKPNIVYLIIESLSRDITGPNAEYGNFVTPFIDSLAEQSLYWENCLSTSAISFEVLPSMIGSLPYGQFGFSMLPVYPNHLSIIKILRANGYYTNFITGAPMSFDNQGAFMRNQGTDYLSYNFPEKYSEMNRNNGWNWGYPDKVIFNYGLETLENRPPKPYMDVYVTIVTHPPYNFNEKSEYANTFDQRIDTLQKSKKDKDNLIKIKEALSSFIYLDDAVNDFINEYKKRDDFNNTIFVITGDHHGYYEPKNVLGKFHVPLIIYSPLLNQQKKFSSIVTHLDIVPSLVNLINSEYDLNMPEYEHWLGVPLDTSRNFNSKQSIPLMNWNKAFDYYLDNKYFMDQNRVYKIIDNSLNIEQVTDTSVYNRLANKMNLFKSVNAVGCYNNGLIPDTLLYKDDKFQNVFFEELIDKEVVSNGLYLSDVRVPISSDFEEIKIEISFDIILPDKPLDSLPKFVTKLRPDNDNGYVFSDTKDLRYLNNDIKTGNWIHMVLIDHMSFDEFPEKTNMEFNAFIHNPHRYNIKISNYSIRILN